jgi:hypothetical protein
MAIVARSREVVYYCKRSFGLVGGGDGMWPQTVIDLILSDDEAECAHLEKLLKVSQEQMVNYYLEAFAEAGAPIMSFDGSASAEDRRAALRAYIRGAKKPLPDS